MVLRICFAALLAAILVAASVPTLVQSTSPAYAAAKEKEATKEKVKKAKKAPSEKQKVARELTSKCNADWREHKKSAKDKNRAAYNAFIKGCRAKK